MLPDSPSDLPASPELAEVRDLVRRLEAQQAGVHGVDTPAYWRAMSDRLQEHLATSRFAPTVRLTGVRRKSGGFTPMKWYL